MKRHQHHAPAVNIVRALMDIIELANSPPPPPPLAPARITTKHSKKIAKAACMLGFEDMIAKFARLPEGVDSGVAAAAAMTLCDAGSGKDAKKKKKKKEKKDKKKRGGARDGKGADAAAAPTDWVPENKLYSLGVAAAEPDARKKLLKYAQKAAKRAKKRAGASDKGNASDDDDDLDQRLQLQMSSPTFMLEFMGHLLSRELGTRDERTSFVPDDWQRKLLDIVDKWESAVICAPTSSGKTFISYYAMEKVLRESDDGVVVYVAPTKALVNQVAAVIYGYFGQKRLPEGRSVFGVLTNNNQHEALNSQILITVPEMFEQLLLNPNHAERWGRNIRYVIFDEVHCIGEEGTGATWEHLLLLIRCPFLALSATIQNPEHFQTWLQKARDVRRKQVTRRRTKKPRDPYSDGRFNVHLIVYSERFSDLQKYVFLPPCFYVGGGGGDKETPTLGPLGGGLPHAIETVHTKGGESFMKALVSQDGTAQLKIVPFHPAAAMTVQRLREQGFPPHMAFAPHETLELYRTMCAVVKEAAAAGDNDAEASAAAASLATLHCDEVFSRELFLSRNDARSYERSIKDELLSWIDRQTPFYTNLAARVLSRFSAPLQDRFERAEKQWMERAQMDCYNVEYMKRNVMGLLLALQSEDMLPALLFSFDRDLCTALATVIVDTLEERESQEREANSEDTKGRDKERKKAAKLAKKQRDKKKSAKEAEEDAQDGVGEIGVGAEADVDPRFTFVQPGALTHCHTQRAP